MVSTSATVESGVRAKLLIEWRRSFQMPMPCVQGHQGTCQLSRVSRARPDSIDERRASRLARRACPMMGTAMPEADSGSPVFSASL
jgi:hypothetical protein